MAGDCADDERPRLGGWFALGVLWGVGVYMRASALWCLVPLGIWVGLMGDHVAGSRVGWRGPVVAMVVVLLTLLPWQFRNYGIFHDRFFGLTTLEGISLYEAVYPDADGGPKQDVIAVPAEMQGLNEAQRNDEWGRRGWGFVFSDPIRVGGLALRKMGRTWSPWLNAADFRGAWVEVGMVLWHVPLFIFALMGIWPLREKEVEGIPFRIKVLLLIPVVYFTGVHALFLGSVRYRVPLMPLVCVFAAAGVLKVVRVGKRGRLGVV